MNAFKSPIPRLILTLTISLLVPTSLVAEISDTVFYEIAQESHEQDVRAFLDVVHSFLTPSSPTSNDDQDSRFTPAVGDTVPLIRRMVEYADQMEPDRVVSLLRIQHIAENPTDLFHDGLVEWTESLLGRWDKLLGTVRPEDVGEGSLPRPYVYRAFNSEDVEAYSKRLASKISASARHSALNPAPRFHAEPLPRADLSYDRSTARSFSLTGSPSLTEAFADYLIDRAIREVVSGTLQSYSLSLLENRSTIGQLIPTITSTLIEDDYTTGLDLLLPALRNAAAIDLANLPVTLLAAQCTDESRDVQTDQLCSTYFLLESIAKRAAPAYALANKRPPTDGACNTIEIVGLIAKEWYDTETIKPTTTIGSFDRFSVRHHKLSVDDDGSDHNSGQPKENFDFFDRLVKAKCTETVDQITAEAYSVLEEVFFRLDELSVMMRPGVTSDGRRVVPVSVIDVLRETLEILAYVEDSFSDTTGRLRLDEFRLLEHMYLAALEQRYSESVTGVLTYLRSWLDAPVGIGGFDGTVQKLARLLVFASDLVEADTSEEFLAAVEAFAGPVGSYVAKRRGAYVTAGAYFGVAAGISEETVGRPVYHVGMALPIGVEVGHSVGAAPACCSVGLFVSPIDFGQVATVRITELASGEHSATRPRIRWGQVFAPSAHLVVGFPRTFPASFAAGLQYVPTADSDSAVGDTMGWLRISVMLAIDVTLLQL